MNNARLYREFRSGVYIIFYTEISIGTNTATQCADLYSNFLQEDVGKNEFGHAWISYLFGSRYSNMIKF